MVTLALFAIGTYFGLQGLALFALVAIGFYIDSQFIFNTNLDIDQEGPRLEDLRLQGVNEGQGIHKFWGPTHRSPGQLIWMGPLRETKVTTTQNVGKGGGGGSVKQTRYYYDTDVAVAIGEGQIDKVSRIWANGKVIYSNRDVAGDYDGDGETDPNPRISSSKISGGVTVYKGTATQGRDATISAREGVANTPAYRNIAYVVFNELELRSFGNMVPTFNFLVRAKGGSVGANTPHGDDGTFAGGGFTPGTGYNVKHCIKDVCLRAGMDESMIDVSGIPDSSFYDLRGYKLTGPQPTQKVLEILMLRYALICQEREGVVYFFPKSDATTHVGDALELAAVEEGDESAPRVTLTDIPDTELPTCVTVGYADPSKDYQRSAQKAQRNEWVYENTHAVDIPLVMKPGEARGVAERLLWEAYRERQVVEFSLPANYTNLQEGDRFSVVSDAESFLARVTEVERGQNFLHKVKGLIESAQSIDYDPDGGVDEGEEGEVDPELPPDLLRFYWVGPAFIEAHTIVYGHYYGVTATPPTAEYQGSNLFDANSSSGPWALYVSGIPDESARVVIADKSTLKNTANAGVGTSQLDLVSSLQVEMMQTEEQLTSLEDTAAGRTQLYDGANTVLLDSGEAFRFMTATPGGTGPNGGQLYTLTKLQRGVRGTENELVHTGAGGGVVLTDSDSDNFVTLAAADVGVTKYLKAVPVGKAEAEVLETDSITYNGGNVKCFAPGCDRYERNNNGNTTLYWRRRTRRFARVFGVTGVPMVPTVEKYEVDLSDDNFSTVKGTVTVTGGGDSAGTSVTITNAEQVAFGLTTLAAFKARIYQIGVGDLMQRGFYREVSIAAV